MANTAPFPEGNILGPFEKTTLLDKITFQVDTRNITVAPTGMFLAGSFFNTIGYTNWTFLPMCDLGGGIWQISFLNVPPGAYQFKFVNGNAPAGWEFQSAGGPCTNALDNNNRFLTVTGGMQLEGPHCFNTCNMFCPGFGDPGVADIAPPLITSPIPANITIACGAAFPPAFALNADDGCDANATTTTGLPVDDLSNLNICGTGMATRDWTVMDCAGNTTTAFQIITITDNTPPTINAPAPPNIIVACGSLPVALGLPASDACDATLTTTGLPTDNTAGIGPCGTGQIIRTWTATDCSGNSATASQTITVTDTSPPVISGLPGSVTVACGNVPAPMALSASDNCDANITTTGLPTDNTTAIGPCGTGTITRTWTVTDCAGNTTSSTQNITVTDNVAPMITGVFSPTLAANCNDPFPVGMPLAASDNCDPSVTTTNPPTDNTSGLSPCGVGQVIRTWSVTDCAGNTATATQTINVIDNTPPNITDPIPQNVTVACGDFPSPAPLTAVDVCDQTVLFTDFPTDDFSGIGPCGTGQIIRTWTVDDCAGNVTSASQTITVADLLPPVITNLPPANISVACGNVPTASPLPASDDCDATLSQTAPPTDDLSGISPCGTGQIIRTWTATDCGGNATIFSQTITVQGNAPPVLTIPANASFECGNVPAASAGDASATDDCGAPAIIYNGETIVGTGCPHELHRSWTATDCDGNTTTLTQIITINDTEAPVFSNTPPNVSVCIGDVPPLSDLTWVDNCDGTGSVSGTDVSDGMTNPETISRTWTYTDACGNVASHTQIITVSETGMANAGPDQALCVGEVANLSASETGGAATVQWSTSGDGIFDNQNAAATTYAPGTGDLASGNVTLTFTPGMTGGACTISPDELILTLSPQLTANAGVNQTIDCQNVTVTLDGSGSTAGAQYEWVGPGITAANMSLQNPTVAQPGLYSLTVSVGNCAATSTVTVFQNNTPPIASAGADVVLTCSQTSVILDGSGTTYGSGFNCIWVGPGIVSGSASATPTVNQPGFYTIVVTNLSSNCTATDTVQVSQDGNLPIADAGSDQTIDCQNVAAMLDGSNSSTGAGIIYQWTAPDSSPLGTSMTQAATIGGTYSLTVSNTTNGCSITSTVEVLVDTLPPVADAGADLILDCGNASVTLGGASSMGPQFSFEWTKGGVPIGTTTTLNASMSSIYALTVTNDDNGCSASDEVEVFQNAALPTANAGANQTLDCSATTVTLDGSGSSVGTEILYQWSGPGGFSSTNQNPSANMAGTYILTVTNSLTSCSAMDSVVVTADGNLPTADAGPDAFLTCAVNEVLLDGGGSSQGADFEYQWTDAGGTMLGSGQTLLINLPGVFTLTVTNTLNGCKAFDAITVAMDTLPPVADAGANAQFTCTQTTAVLDGSGSSSGTDYGYAWSGPNVSGNHAAVISEATEIGVYTLTVSDLGNGCTAFDEVEITQNPDVPTANAGLGQSLTCVVGSVTLQGSASLPSATFMWSGPGITVANQTLPNPTVSIPGTYSLIVTDPVTGCKSPPATVVVGNDQMPPAVSVFVNGSLDCVNNSVLLDGSGSAQGAGILYQWFFDNNLIVNGVGDTWTAVAVGDYTLEVTNAANGCTASQTVQVVDDADLPPAAISGPGLLNCDISQITLSETGAAGLPNIAYGWSTPDGHFTQNQLDQPTVGLDAAGQYIVTVLNTANGCSASDTVTVAGDFEIPVVSFDQTFSIGCDGSAAVLSVNVQGNAGGFVYSWAGAGFSSMEANPSVSISGTYEVVVTMLSNGCTASASTVVGQVSGIAGVEISKFSPTCPGSLDGSMIVENVDGQNSPFLFSLNGVDFSPQTDFDNLTPGDYTLTVQDATGCVYEEDFVIENAAGVFVELGGDLTINLGEGVELSPVFSPSVVSFSWSEMGTLSCADCPKPTASPLETTTYNLVVVDAAGCEATDQVTVFVERNVGIYAPTAFSPNGDGINDVFTLFAGNQVVSIHSFQIFDRWGDHVFDAREIPAGDVNFGWDGKRKGKLMDAGVYVFWAEVLLTDGTTAFVKGEVLLVK